MAGLGPLRHQTRSLELVTDATLLVVATLTVTPEDSAPRSFPVGSLWTARAGRIVGIEAFATAELATARARKIGAGPVSPRALRTRGARPRPGLRLAACAAPGRTARAPIGVRPA
jgi:hypothetical protein